MKVKYQPMCKATFEQDGWHTIEEQPLVHSNYNATIGQICGACLLFVAILVIVLLAR